MTIRCISSKEDRDSSRTGNTTRSDGDGETKPLSSIPQRVLRQTIPCTYIYGIDCVSSKKEITWKRWPGTLYYGALTRRPHRYFSLWIILGCCCWWCVVPRGSRTAGHEAQEKVTEKKKKMTSCLMLFVYTRRLSLRDWERKGTAVTLPSSFLHARLQWTFSSFTDEKIFKTSRFNQSLFPLDPIVVKVIEIENETFQTSILFGRCLSKEKTFPCH